MTAKGMWMENQARATVEQGAIALILSSRLGDTLFLMNIASNLRRAGRTVVAYGTHGRALAQWYPGFDIRPLPPEDEIAALGAYATIIQMDLDAPMAGLAGQFAQFRCIKAWNSAKPAAGDEAMAGKTPADDVPPHRGRPAAGRCNGVMASFRAFTQALFALKDWVEESGLQAPAGLRPRLHARQIILHPTSSEASRCWRPDQYVTLATTLRGRGFEPVFVLAPDERAEWRKILSPHGLPILDAPDLAQTAAVIYESGWFIGTDSGIGHLASACGVPTVTIVDRPRNMQRWRPMWAPGLVVRPWWLPLRSLRRKYWREATTVGKVLRTFDRLRSAVDKAAGYEPMPAAASAAAGAPVSLRRPPDPPTYR